MDRTELLNSLMESGIFKKAVFFFTAMACIHTLFPWGLQAMESGECRFQKGTETGISGSVSSRNTDIG
jgi:hypothetical protein